MGSLVLIAALAFGGGPASAAAAAPAGSSPWPEALHDATHSATASVAGPATGHVEWTRPLGGNITPGPVVGANGTIYVATNAGVLHAIDPATGTDVWTFDGGAPYIAGADLSTSPLILPSGSILWPGPQDTLFDLSASGQALWSHRLSGTVLSPVLSGTRVYVGLMSGSLRELDVSGSMPELGWSVTIGHQSFGNPVVSPDGHVITTVDKSVVSIADRGTSGVVRWRHTASATIEVSPSVAVNGDVYVTANDGSAYALREDGTLIWRKHIGQESYSSSSVSPSGLLYFGDNGGSLNIVRASDGDLVRSDHGLRGIWSAQVIDAHGDVYFGSQGHYIYGFNASGRQLFRVHARGPIDSYPALTGNGTLIIGDQVGTLYAIG